MRAYFVHGLFSSTMSFMPLLKALPKCFKSYLIPLGGHQNGTKLSSMTFEHMTDNLIRQTADLPVPDLLVGSSYGGKLLINGIMNDMFPKNIPLVLLDVAPIPYRSENTRLISEYMVNNSILSLQGSDFPLEIRSILEDNYNIVEGSWSCDGALINENIKAVSGFVQKPTSPLTNPTLVLRGTKSLYVPESLIANRLNLFFDNYTIKNIEAGHFLHREYPDICASEIFKFITRTRTGQ
jgi:esterase